MLTSTKPAGPAPTAVYQPTLKDLLTGALPGGGGVSNIPLGFNADPQFNKFTYNISGNMGPSSNPNGIVPPGGLGTNLSGGFSGTSPGLGSSPSTGQGRSDGRSLGTAVGSAANGFNSFPWQNTSGLNTGPSYMGSYNTGHLNQLPSYMGNMGNQYGYNNPGWPFMPSNYANGSPNPGSSLRNSLTRL